MGAIKGNEVNGSKNDKSESVRERMTYRDASKNSN